MRKAIRAAGAALVPGLALAAASAASASASAATAAGAVDEFTITLGQTVEPGVPGPGAGDIELPGNQDVYTFTATAGQRIYFDHLETSNSSLRWSGLEPDGDQIFSGAIFSDRGPYVLTESGTYMIVVDDNADATGTYSFIVRETNIDGPYAISTKDVVEPGVPAAGAGEIEAPGDQDVYELGVVVGQQLFFDNLFFSNSSIRWSLFDDGGEQVFSSPIFSDRGPYEVTASGTWTIIVDDNSDQFGTYSFTVWEAETDGPFPIAFESIVSPGVPAAGAGEIEEPGDTDIYEFTAVAGQRAYFQNIETSNTSLRWQLEGPDGKQIFTSPIFSDQGPMILEAGVHRIIVDDNSDEIGTYSFQIWDTNIDGPFAIALETLVGPGIPAAGAGEIDDPGDQDRYTFTGTSGQTLFFQNVETSNSSLRWRVIAPDGEELFDSPIFSDIGPLVLDQDGTYEIVADDNGDATGTYSFIVWETDDDQFSINLNEIVSVDDPGPGAGWIEQPGNIDRYLIEGSAGDEWCAVNLDTDNTSLRWRLLDPKGGTLFDAPIFSDQASLPLLLDGTYVLEVFDNGEDVGMYSFVVNRTTRADVTGDCVVGFDDVLAVLSNWGPCADPDDCREDIDESGIVGFDDILQVLSQWTQ